MNFRFRGGLGFLGLLVSLSFLSSVSVQAQVPTADLLGTVTDSSGAAVPGAHVTARNVGTGQARTTEASASGDYVFTFLQIGTYSVSVEAQGFKKFTAPNVVLAAGDRVRVDAKMEVGQVTQTVEVTATTPALQTDSSVFGGLVTQQGVQDLPLNGRNFINLAQLAPGASEGNPNGFDSGTRPDDRRGTSEIVANAQIGVFNNKMVDGMDNNERIIGTIGVQPSIDAIQEVRVMTNLYPADVGRTPGAVINIITKSGTNSFHGSAFEFIQNDIFNSRSYFDTAAVGPKPHFRQNQFGASLGGPIRKDKTFFFGDYEGLRGAQGLPVPLGTVPTDCELGRAACNGLTQPGNFSDLLPNTVIYDPTTGAPFANNIIPLNRINAISENFASLFPSPNLPGFSNNFGATPSRTQNSDTVDARVDQHFNDSNTLTARYTLNDVTTATPGTFPAVSVAGLNIKPGGDVPGSINSFAGNAHQIAQNAALYYFHIFSPNLVMQLNVAYLRINTFSTPLNYQTNASEAFGLQGINSPDIANGYATGLPLLNISGYSNLGDDNFVPLKDVDNTMQYNGNITWTKGNHSLKFGVGLIRRNFTNIQSQYPDANFVFSPLLTNSTESASGTGGNAFASLLLGYPLTQARNLSLTAPYYGTWEPSAHAEDDWRARSWLTLNLGLRYDIFTPFTERHNLLSNFDPVNGVLVVASNSDRTALVGTDYSNISPRLGFAATLGHGMVVRGGFGTVYFPANYASQFSYKNPPFVSSFVSSTPLGVAPFSPPVYSTPLPAPVATPQNDPGGQINAVAPGWTPSHIYQTNLTVQKEFSGNVVTVGYLGEFGHRLSTTIDINQLNTPGPQPSGTRTVTAPNPAQPYYGTVPNVSFIMQQQNAASSRYNALQISFERRARSGLTIFANYTYSHEVDDYIYPGLGLAPACPPTFDCIVDNGNGSTHVVHGLNYDNGNGTFDIRNRAVFAANYELPFGKSLSGFRGVLARGWQVNNIATWSSGLPFTVQESAPLAQTTGTGGNLPGSRPNLIASTGVANRSTAAWFNTSAFGAQVLGTLGNAGRDILSGPPLRHWDISLFKDFSLNEQMHLQFRWEIFNVTNTPSFSNPGANIVSFDANGIATTAGGLGRINSIAANSTPRQMQFGLKFLF